MPYQPAATPLLPPQRRLLQPRWSHTTNSTRGDNFGKDRCGVNVSLPLIQPSFCTRGLVHAPVTPHFLLLLLHLHRFQMFTKSEVGEKERSLKKFCPVLPRPRLLMTLHTPSSSCLVAEVKTVRIGPDQTFFRSRT